MLFGILFKKMYNKAAFHILKEKELYYKELEAYILNLEDAISVLRQFRHDYINILTTISMYLEAKSYNELSDYFNNTILPTKDALYTESEDFLPLTYIKDIPLKSILFTKRNTALKKNIDMKIETNCEIHIVAIKPLSMARLMGILLDNAIEAASETDSPKITIYFNHDKTSQRIIIVNNMKPIVLDTASIYEKNFSTKGNNRGLGLYIAKEILNEYKNVSYTIDTDIDCFIFTITVENP